MDTSRTKFVFVGNLASNVSDDMIRDLFVSASIRIAEDSNAIDRKMGFAFVKCINDDDLAGNVKYLNHKAFPETPHRKLTIEFTKTTEEELKQREHRRQQMSQPTNCLFVVGYDPFKTKPHYLEYEFESVAKVTLIEMFSTYCLVYFRNAEDATKVLNAYNGKEFFGKVLTVEYKVASGYPKGNRGNNDRNSNSRPVRTHSSESTYRDRDRDRIPDGRFEPFKYEHAYSVMDRNNFR